MTGKPQGVKPSLHRFTQHPQNSSELLGVGTQVAFYTGAPANEIVYVVYYAFNPGTDSG